MTHHARVVEQATHRVLRLALTGELHGFALGVTRLGQRARGRAGIVAADERGWVGAVGVRSALDISTRRTFSRKVGDLRWQQERPCGTPSPRHDCPTGHCSCCGQGARRSQSQRGRCGRREYCSSAHRLNSRSSAQWSALGLTGLGVRRHWSRPFLPVRSNVCQRCP